jgi:hypothetical protein
MSLLVAILAGGWFYTTIPAPPSPPPNLVAPDSTVEWPAVRAQLLRMQWGDQAVRERAVDSLLAERPQGIVGVLRALRVFYLERRVDEAHTARLKEIVAEHGWPHAGRVGGEAAEAAFLLAQHADHDLAFQRRALDSLRRAYAQGEATGPQVALLTDRVRVAEGAPQEYGTQAEIRDGTVRFHPIRDSATVDQRRLRIGLPPLSTYVDTLKAKFESGEGAALPLCC